MAQQKKPQTDTNTPSEDLIAQAIHEGQPPFTCPNAALVRCSDAPPDASATALALRDLSVAPHRIRK